MALTGVLILRQRFDEGESFTLFSWARAGSAIEDSVSRADFRGVLHAANGVAHTLAGAPARCLFLDVPLLGSDASRGSAPVTAAFLDARGALLVVLLEGRRAGASAQAVHVSEAAAVSAAGCVLDALYALAGPGVVDEGAAMWGSGGAVSVALLRAACDAISSGAGTVGYASLNPEWAMLAAHSAAAAAHARATADAETWPADKLAARARAQVTSLAVAGLRVPRDALAVGALTVAASTGSGIPSLELLSASGSSAGLLSAVASELAALEADAMAQAANVAHGATLAAVELELETEGSSSGALDARGAPRDTLRALRALRCTVVGSFAAMLPPRAGAPFVALSDRLPSHGAAALATLLVATLAPTMAMRTNASVSAHLSALAAAGSALPPLPAALPESAIEVRCDALHAFTPRRGGDDGADDDHSVASASPAALLSTLLPPSEVLAARGVLRAPGVGSSGAAAAKACTLHAILGLMPLGAHMGGAAEELTLPASGTWPVMWGPDGVLVQPSTGSGEGGSDWADWSAVGGAGASRGRAHLAILLLVHQSQAFAGGGGGEGDGDAGSSTARKAVEGAIAGTLAALQAAVRTSAASLALSPGLAHLAGIIAACEADEHAVGEV